MPQCIHMVWSLGNIAQKLNAFSGKMCGLNQADDKNLEIWYRKQTRSDKIVGPQVISNIIVYPFASHLGAEYGLRSSWAYNFDHILHRACRSQYLYNIPIAGSVFDSNFENSKGAIETYLQTHYYGI